MTLRFSTLLKVHAMERRHLCGGRETVSQVNVALNSCLPSTRKRNSRKQTTNNRRPDLTTNARTLQRARGRLVTPKQTVHGTSETLQTFVKGCPRDHHNLKGRHWTKQGMRARCVGCSISKLNNCTIYNTGLFL